METKKSKVKEEDEIMASNPKTWKDVLKFPHIASLILLALVAAAIHITRNNYDIVLRLQNQVFVQEEQIINENDTSPSCNLFSGRWVYDDVSYPLYKEGQCSFMEEDFACEQNGRKKLKYQNWRWQPYDCDLPRFNGTTLLEKLRGKKLVFVGDSLMRNQWRSMLCLIDSSLLPSSTKSLNLNGNFNYFHSMEYNATIGFYWSPFLVESNGDGIVNHGSKSSIIRIKSIEKHGRHWSDADILVFDSYAWWITPSITILWGSFGSPDAIYKKVQMRLRLYEMTLNTWSNWLEMHLNPNKTKLFFMSPSPFRRGGTKWGTSPNCYNETEPILVEDYYWANDTNKGMMEIAQATINKLGKIGLKAEYLNITELSSYRDDARPSIYRPFWEGADKNEIIKKPEIYSDCLHWCLPGVPDAWNLILFAYIMEP